MTLQLVILGAGNSIIDQSPKSVQKVNLNKRVLDWQIQGFAKLNPEVFFVGGYEIEKIIELFPQFQFLFNKDWKDTGSCHSLAIALNALCSNGMAGKRDLLITYSDILIGTEFTDTFVKPTNSFIKYAVSTISPRTMKQEKKIETISTGQETFEFVGAVHVPADLVSDFLKSSLNFSKKNPKAYLSTLFEYLIEEGTLALESEMVDGLWAHAEDSNSISNFVLGSKAATLSKLQRHLEHSEILPLFFFCRGRYLENKQKIIQIIIDKFHKNRKLVVRSSARNEDGFDGSMAGKFCSELNVDVTFNALEQAISKVFNSYEGSDDNDQVLVQPQLNNVVLSGVVFTRSLGTAAPYYVINYATGDDTTAITGGISYAGEKFILSRRHQESFTAEVPKPVQRILTAVREIEAIAAYDCLDIEFAQDEAGKIYTLQVRPLVIKDEFMDRGVDNAVFDCQQHIHSTLLELQTSPPGQLGKRTMWSVMADWNPAEMIGLRPSPFAFDLYRRLISDKIWSIQRFEAGYRDLRGWPLIRLFGGHAFVDVRASLNSLIPRDLNPNIAEIIINRAFEALEKKPVLHDQIEFELLPTSLDFDFGKWEEFYADSLSFSEMEQLKSKIRTVTKNIMGRVEADYALAHGLEQKFTEMAESQPKDMHWLPRAMASLEQGTLCFSHLARAAFVAVAFLKSGVKKSLISEARVSQLLENSNGLGKMLTDDAYAVKIGKMEKQKFIGRIGHLRPGTYDITSPAYKDDIAKFIDPLISRASAREVELFSWTEDERQKIEIALKHLSLDLDAEQFLTFIQKAIFGREYAKFVFSILLSEVITHSSSALLSLGVSKDKLEYSTLEFCLESAADVWGYEGTKEYKDKLSNALFKRYKLGEYISLPSLIKCPNDIFNFKVPDAEQSFITMKSVIAPVFVISAAGIPNEGQLEGNIVAVVNADPGYDYLFSLGIKGLVTAYGGPNSHMAIRAAEFGLPAVIGIGEEQFKTLKSGMTINIDCKKQVWNLS